MTDRERFEQWKQKWLAGHYFATQEEIWWHAWQAARAWIPVVFPPEESGFYLCRKDGVFIGEYRTESGTWYTLDGSTIVPDKWHPLDRSTIVPDKWHPFPED